jgi:hypothetical protein
MIWSILDTPERIFVVCVILLLAIKCARSAVEGARLIREGLAKRRRSSQHNLRSTGVVPKIIP